jgi:hypothetical protein
MKRLISRGDGAITDKVGRTIRWLGQSRQHQINEWNGANSPSDELSVVVQLIGDYYRDHGPNGYG